MPLSNSSDAGQEVHGLELDSPSQEKGLHNITPEENLFLPPNHNKTRLIEHYPLPPNIHFPTQGFTCGKVPSETE